MKERAQKKGHAGHVVMRFFCEAGDSVIDPEVELEIPRIFRIAISRNMTVSTFFFDVESQSHIMSISCQWMFLSMVEI